MATNMDVDEIPSAKNQKNVVSTATVASVSVALHPLVLMNISEHWTRFKAQFGAPQQVLGAMIGNQNGREIEVMNSFELVSDIVSGDIIINKDYYETKTEQFKQVFPDLDLIGWYTTGGSPDDSDIKVHTQICTINESPILVKLNPMVRHSDTLPIKCYESVIDIVKGETKMLFVELPYTLATEEAERIGVDHVARVCNVEASGNQESVVTQHLSAQYSAIKMLYNRIQIITAYLEAVMKGELELNQEIMRECNSLCRGLPILNNKTFNKEFFNQCNDVEVLAYLGIITKGCQVMNQFVTKFNVLHDRQGPGGSRRMRGLFL